MNVLLTSTDTDLFKLCGDILNEYDGIDCHFSKVAPGVRPTEADLYIWDGPPPVDLPVDLDHHFSRHLFLLQRSEVAAFRENLGAAEAAILLKPVTRPALAAFLDLAAAAFHNHISTARSLRSDRDEILQCLIQSNLQLQQYEQDRTNFLTRAVHDFRAPLTATNGYCGLLLGEALGPLSEEQKEVLRRMQHSLKRLSRMASAMFELGVGRHLKRQPDLQPADIREPVEQALHEITPFAEAKNISVSVDLAPGSGMVHLESGQIEQVLMNLLDNACKFTPKGGAIEVRGYPMFWERRTGRRGFAPAGERRFSECRLPNAYRIDILDSGPPIPPEHIGRLFEEYTSYTGGKDRSGGGLGLAICKMIITAHEGRVWMENTEYGPRFSFVLPVHSAKPGGTRTDHELELLTSEIN
jgi:signal transduction histidine kinase